MTLRTVTYDDTKFKIVPLEPTIVMQRALYVSLIGDTDESKIIKEVIAAAPEYKESEG